MYPTKSYAAQSATSPLAPFSFERRDPLPDDVQIDIEFCGVCHSDLHTVRSEWGESKYPCVPGHEIVGRVAKVGRDVKKFREGDLAAVGCMVDSCGECESCRADLEQFCERGVTFTYNGDGQTQRRLHLWRLLEEHRGRSGIRACACRPSSIWRQLRRCSAPASRLTRRCGSGKSARDKQVGVVGLGGLGHMAVKFAHAFGAHVVLFTTSRARKPMRSTRRR